MAVDTKVSNDDQARIIWTPNHVRLKNGALEEKSFVEISMVSLENMKKFAPKDFEEVVAIAHDPSHKIKPELAIKLKDWNILKRDSNANNLQLDEHFRNVVLSAVKGGSLKIEDPVSK